MHYGVFRNEKMVLLAANSPAGTTHVTGRKCRPCGTWAQRVALPVRRLKPTVNTCTVYEVRGKVSSLRDCATTAPSCRRMPASPNLWGLRVKPAMTHRALSLRDCTFGRGCTSSGIWWQVKPVGIFGTRCNLVLTWVVILEIIIRYFLYRLIISCLLKTIGGNAITANR